MNKQYSKVYPVEGEELVGYRYNYAEGVLEYVSKFDFDTEGSDLIVRELPQWQVVSSIGLSRENWQDNPEYWVDLYQNELDEEVSAELAFEFGSQFREDSPPSAAAGDYSPISPWNAPGMSARDFI